MTAFHNVWIYVFPVNDSSCSQQRLCLAVTDYCKSCGIPIPQPEKLAVVRTEKGKPYFPYSPHIHFSISHSGEYWSCAIADQTIGYDLQEPVLPRNETPEEQALLHQKMASRFFHPAEAEFVSMDCLHNFFAVWSAREAYVKYTGQGIDRYFSEHCVVPDSLGEQCRISGTAENVGWYAMGCFFWKAYYDGGYTMCVCTEKPCNYTVIPHACIKRSALD